jgi:hypothetical protein
MRCTLLIPIILSGWISCANAAEPADAAMTAGDLQLLCMGDDHVSINVCRVFILGVTQGIAVGVGIADARGARPCVPKDTSAEALEESVKARLNEDLIARPADGHRDASGFIATGLVEKYGCRRGH